VRLRRRICEITDGSMRDYEGGYMRLRGGYMKLKVRISRIMDKDTYDQGGGYI
jgi:hypothetical protein